MNIKTKILVVDDETALKDIVSKILEQEGYDVDMADCGETALDLCFNKNYDIILSDIRMKKLDGISLLKKVKQHNDETQVILMTSHASLDTVIDAMRAGAYDYLTKPFDNFELLSVTKRAAERLELIRENQNLIQQLTEQNEKLEDANIKLNELAIRDGLTGLFNRRFLIQSLKKEISRSHRHNHQFALLFFDVDFFKAYNDTYGHLSGDHLLVALGSILKNRLRESDTAARYGGEEFIVLLTETGRNDSIEVAENIRKTIADHKFVDEEGNPTTHVTVSIGVATFPDDGTTDESLIKCADDRLYFAKNNGKNQIQYIDEKRETP